MGRYWNDCSEIYKTLINVYQYPKSHIFVLMSDGTSSGLDRNLGLTEFGPFDSSPTDLDGDNIADITHYATQVSYPRAGNVYDEFVTGVLNHKDNLL